MHRTPGPTLPSTTTRMTWLYNTLSHFGETYEFGQPSRAWLVDRLAVSDYSSRRDRAPSEWWEEDKNNNHSTNHTNTSVKPKLGHYPFSASMRGGMLQKDPPPDLSLTQVLASSTYRADFENFLEENLAGPALPFREAVQEWQDKYKTAHVWDPKGLDRLKGEAIKIYQQFLSPTAAEKLDVDRIVLLRLKKALKIETQPPQLLRSTSEANDDLDSLTVHQMLERAEQYVDHALARRVLDTLQVIPQEDQEGLCERAFAILTDKVKPKPLVDPDDDGIPVEFSGVIFADAYKQITQMLENLFSDFKQTDDYSDMFENDNASTAIRPSASIGSSSSEVEESVFGGSTNGDESNNDDLLLETDTGRVRCPAWYNTEGWRSLKCEILDLHTKLSNVRAIINMDSTTYRTSLADRDFRAGVLAEFALTNTTQYLTIRLRSGNRLAGILDLSMFAISQMTQGAETLHSVKQVSKNQNLAKMELKLKITCRKEDPGPCSLQQVLVEGMKGGFTTSLARGLVSKKKRRFQQDGFDLDLSYVTDQLIAMGYPSSGAEGVYRNPLESVQKFFSLRHPQAYLLYNLCSERQYDISKFQGRVRCFPCDDHNPPPFAMIKRFCEDVRLFLNEHPQHAVSVHCKAGKGRTGTMLAAYMCYTGMEPNSYSALNTFAQSRTKNGKGVTIPSQERYVHYFGKYCKLKRAGKRMPGRTTLILQAVNLHEALLQSNSTIIFSVTQRPESDEEGTGSATTANTSTTNTATVVTPTTSAESSYSNEDKPRWHKYSKTLSWDMSKYVLALSDDVLFEFYEKTMSGNKVKLFQFWFNTRMCELRYLDNLDDPEPRLILEKRELDKASKDTKHKDYSPDFKVELVFALTCSSGIVKTQELDERLDTPSLTRLGTTPGSPARKLPPPLPPSYSTRKLLSASSMSHISSERSSDRDSLFDDESMRQKSTPTLLPAASSLVRTPSNMSLDSNEHSKTIISSISSDTTTNATTATTTTTNATTTTTNATTTTTNATPAADSATTTTVATNTTTHINNNNTTTATSTSTTVATPEDDASSLTGSTSKLQPISVNVLSSFSSVEIPEPSSPVPSKAPNHTDEGLEHFSFSSKPSVSKEPDTSTGATVSSKHSNDNSSISQAENEPASQTSSFVSSLPESASIASDAPVSLEHDSTNPFAVTSEISLPESLSLPNKEASIEIEAVKALEVLPEVSATSIEKVHSETNSSSQDVFLENKESLIRPQGDSLNTNESSEDKPPPAVPVLERIPTGEPGPVTTNFSETAPTSALNSSEVPSEVIPTRVRVATLPRSPPKSETSQPDLVPPSSKVATLPRTPSSNEKVATLPRTPNNDPDTALSRTASHTEKVATLPRTLSKDATSVALEQVATLPRTSSNDVNIVSGIASEDETTKSFCERLFGTSKPRMDMAFAALTSFGVEIPRADMEPWIERDWLDFEKSTNKVIRAKVQTDLATALKPTIDRYEALRRQAEEAEVALRAEIRAKPPPPPKRVPNIVRAFEGAMKS